jgi:hypothetical protein
MDGCMISGENMAFYRFKQINEPCKRENFRLINMNLTGNC